MDTALTVDEACARLGGICRSNFYGLVRSGRLRTVKIGTRTVVRQSEIVRFLDAAEAGDDQ